MGFTFSVTLATKTGNVCGVLFFYCNDSAMNIGNSKDKTTLGIHLFGGNQVSKAYKDASTFFIPYSFLNRICISYNAAWHDMANEIATT